MAGSVDHRREARCKSRRSARRVTILRIPPLRALDQDRFVNVSFHIDTNRVNARTSLPYMNQLEKWRRDGVILMQMSEVARGEALAGGSPNRGRKVRSYIFTQTMNLIEDEQRLLHEIAAVLFPDGPSSDNERNDIEIVFNAWKLSAILVTADGGSRRQPGGILGHRDELKRLGITVLTDEEAVALVKKKIAERDGLAAERRGWKGSPLPAWVGVD